MAVKEADSSVLETYAGRNAYAHHGERVVQGRRLMQPDSDLFLGWATGPKGRQPILFKTVVYTVIVFLVRCLEKSVEYWLDGGTIAAIPDYLTHHFSWHFHATVQIWIFVLFIIDTSATELDARLARGVLARILFDRRAPTARSP